MSFRMFINQKQSIRPCFITVISCLIVMLGKPALILLSGTLSDLIVLCVECNTSLTKIDQQSGRFHWIAPSEDICPLGGIH